jgi:hypothetical protein
MMNGSRFNTAGNRHLSGAADRVAFEITLIEFV